MRPLLVTVAVLAVASIQCGAAAPSPSSPAQAAAGEVRWGYTGAGGPEHWGDLMPEYSTCSTGRHQTPVDLASSAPREPSLKAPAFGYGPIPLVVLNNGHTVEVENTAKASIVAGGEAWDLLQFHLHAPSEHTVDGKVFDAELHLVHKNRAGQLAVVGVLITKGRENRVLKAVLDDAPAEVTADARSVPGAMVDLPSLVPSASSYFTYDGSLTTPPCSEGVRWFVSQTPIELSEEQNRPPARPVSRQQQPPGAAARREDRAPIGVSGVSPSTAAPDEGPPAAARRGARCPAQRSSFPPAPRF